MSTEPDIQPERPSLVKDIKRLRKHIKKVWFLGLALGLVCHLVPAEYHDACKAVVSACTP